MIIKSYQIEENLSFLKENISLFYGENLGLINLLKHKIKLKYKKNEFLVFDQQEILNNENKFFNELNNVSLFQENKIFFIHNTNDQILKILDEIIANINSNRIFLFAGILEKRSKLRIFFEKEKSTNIIPCYQDNNLSIRKIIQSSLKNYSNLTPNIVNIILENCGCDRIKLYNEINKIKSYFIEKKIVYEDVLKLLDAKEDGDFNLIKDSSLSGETIKTNNLLNSFIVESEKIVFYISTINYRLEKLKNISEHKLNNIEETISNMKPPIFWKDKPVFIKQAKIWDKNKLTNALSKSYTAEMRIKSNSSIDKNTIFKKLIVDICNIANAA